MDSFGTSVGSSVRFLSRGQHISKLLYPGSFRVIQATPYSMADQPIKTQITNKLTEAFKPRHLEVINESFMHNVPKGSESHFKVVIVSDQFNDLALIKRHRLVNAALKHELDGPVHALSIQAKTPKQWEENNTVTKSPSCMGGMAHERRQKEGAS